MNSEFFFKGIVPSIAHALAVANVTVYKPIRSDVIIYREKFTRTCENLASTPSSLVIVYNREIFTRTLPIGLSKQ